MLFLRSPDPHTLLVFFLFGCFSVLSLKSYCFWPHSPLSSTSPIIKKAQLAFVLSIDHPQAYPDISPNYYNPPNCDTIEMQNLYSYSCSYQYPVSNHTVNNNANYFFKLENDWPVCHPALTRQSPLLKFTPRPSPAAIPRQSRLSIKHSPGSKRIELRSQNL